MPSNNRPYHFSGESIITTNRFADLLSNAMTSRAKLISKGMETDDRRDIAKECGEPATAQIDTATLRDLYERLGVAKRVVNILPDECWASEPEVYESEDEEEETAFEEAWGELNSNLSGKSHFNGGSSPVWQYLHKIDSLSGIGNYGVLLLGLNDGKELVEPVKASDKLKLIYLRAFDQTLCQITRYEADRSSPRYGMPLEYQITLNDPRQTGTGGIGLQIATMRVHWTRVIHVADNRVSSEVFGEPRMLPVLNNLLALRKLYSGSAEMFWRGAFPGYSLETHPQLGGDVEVDVDELRDMMESYGNGLQRYLTLSGMSVKPLSPQVSDPTAQINAHIKAICITYGIPERIFMGSERGELASSQDQGAWNDRLRTRQSLYLLPHLIIPFTDRLISFGVLPVPDEGYNAHWPDVNTLSDLEKAQVAAQRTAALVQYVGGGGDAVVTPIDFLTRFLYLDQQEALEILEKTEEELAKEQEEAPTPVPGEMPPEPPPQQQPPQDGAPQAPQGGGPQNPLQLGSPTGNQGVDNSYLGEYERDDRGRCLPRNFASAKEAKDYLWKEHRIEVFSDFANASKEAIAQMTISAATEIDRINTEFTGLGKIEKFDLILQEKMPYGRQGKFTPASFGADKIRVRSNLSMEDPPPVIGQGNWLVSDESYPSVVRHEIGHSLQRHYMSSSGNTEAGRAFAAIANTPGLFARGGHRFTREENRETHPVSQYAGGDPKELFAESFAAYTNPQYERGSLPSNIEGFMDKYVKGGRD